jgi:hypothetical protein
VFAMSFPRSKKKLYTEGELYEYAVGALARRMRSVAELSDCSARKSKPILTLARLWSN